MSDVSGEILDLLHTMPDLRRTPTGDLHEQGRYVAVELTEAREGHADYLAFLAGQIKRELERRKAQGDTQTETSGSVTAEMARELRDWFDFACFLSQSGQAIEWKGTHYEGRCLLHRDQAMLFWLWPTGLWWCYGCGSGGDVYDWLVAVSRTLGKGELATWGAAVRWLRDYAGEPIRIGDKSEGRERVKPIYEVFADVVAGPTP